MRIRVWMLLAVLGLFGVLGLLHVMRSGSDIAVVNQPSAPVSVVLFGDSMGAGAGATKGKNLAVLLGDRLNVKISNASIGGETTAGGIKRCAGMLKSKPGIVIVFLGGNDRIQKVKASRAGENLDKIARQCQDNGAMVVLVGFKGMLGDGYTAMFKEIAKRRGCVFVPDVLDGIFFNPKLKADAIHPNDEGYALIADRIATKMKPYLEK